MTGHKKAEPRRVRPNLEMRLQKTKGKGLPVKPDSPYCAIKAGLGGMEWRRMRWTTVQYWRAKLPVL